MIDFRILLSAAAFAILLPAAAQAACSNPAGDEGDLVYNQGWRIAQYCDGTNWRVAMKAGAPGTGDCTDPVRSEGAIIYNEDDNVPQVCIGGWRALGPINPSAGSGGCSSPTKDEGVIIYNSDDKVMQYCDGSQWVKLLGPAPENCPNVGDICIDGSIYAGISPADGKRMFVPRCDAGMTYDGTMCQGARPSLSWVDGQTNYTHWGSSSSDDGRFNTDFLIQFDSNSVAPGLQAHQAAQFCADVVAHGRDDWYLPARNELGVIHAGLVDGVPIEDRIYGFLSGYYWSSSEITDNFASQVHMSSGTLGQTNKFRSNPVRCARR